MDDSKQDKNYNVNTRNRIWGTIIFFAVIISLCAVMSICNSPVKERAMTDKLIRINSIVRDASLDIDIRQKALDILAKTDDTSFVYNINGLVWFAGTIIGLIFLYIIFAPVKYEWNEMLKNDRCEKAKKTYDDLINKTGKLKEQLSTLDSLVKQINVSIESGKESIKKIGELDETLGELKGLMEETKGLMESKDRSK